MSKKKRIALVINTLSGGGAEKTVSNLSRGLAGQYDIDIVVNDKACLDYPYRGRILSLGMPSGMKRTGVIYQILAVCRRTRALRWMKKSRKYAAVISFSEMTSLANVLSGNRFAKTVISVRNSVSRRKGQGLKQRLVLSLFLPYACRRADRTVSCSEEIAADLRAHYGLTREKSAVIYNGLELSRIRSMAAEPLPEEEETAFSGKKLLVTAGRLTGQKGQRHLLKAVKILKDQGIPAFLVILGEGELRASLEQAAGELGIKDQVYMPGFVENPYKYMARADVFVMPSLYEGFCNAVLEALACGAPVISTDHETGAREILAPGTDYRKKVKDRIDEAEYGILVPVCGDSSEGESGAGSGEERLLAEAIRRVLTDEKLAAHYREAAEKRAEEMNIESVCREWSRVIEAE